MTDAYEQTKQTNETNMPRATTGRPPDVGEEAVIAAGCVIRERGCAVTPTALRRELGQGRPQRLKEISGTGMPLPKPNASANAQTYRTTFSST
mgnify:CR=1 FL=1